MMKDKESDAPPSLSYLLFQTSRRGYPAPQRFGSTRRGKKDGLSSNGGVRERPFKPTLVEEPKQAKPGTGETAKAASRKRERKWHQGRTISSEEQNHYGPTPREENAGIKKVSGPGHPN